MATLGGKVVLFGGTSGAQVFDETWEWDGQSWSQRHVTGPPARVAHQMATLGGKVVLFGGNTLVGMHYVFFSDTWEWDGSGWTESNGMNPTPARNSAAMAAR